MITLLLDKKKKLDGT